jgi:hypothetical protein
MSRNTLVSLPLVALVGVLGGAFPAHPTALDERRKDVVPAPMEELWVEPDQPRNLIDGVGGDDATPVAEARYKVVKRESGGFSISYHVQDERDREWSVKIGPEAPIEVVISRIVWALGYHQVPSYFLQRWMAVEDGHEQLRGGARFRPRDLAMRSEGEWKWDSNPFVGTPPYSGLLALMVLLNASDLKDENNELYQLDDVREGARRWYVIKDLGSALGETAVLEPRRGFIDAFEHEPFITGRRGSHLRFGFHGRRQDLIKQLTVSDVKWISDRLLAITDEQWHDAFAAGGYDEAMTSRFVARIKQKAREGEALP